MPARVGINGFGRMGRLALRAAIGNREFKVVHSKELKGNAATAAHLLEFDSVHGRWNVPIEAEDAVLTVQGQRLGYSRFGSPGEVPWEQAKVDIVLECTGRFLTPIELHPYFGRGVRKV